ncbi:YesL family protein [Sutcliffiella deserti]|uniref:YesL family protein n=1 Tax=Sutcliffiella deserti TaxID=2875501 RepID=UPI001CC0FC18|nr:YesL family protein [Sutcliffiella deserti]
MIGMDMGGLWGGFYNVSQVIARLAYLNLLWISFTVLGGIAFGIMPATIAVFSLIRKWRQGESDLPIIKTFWHYYKKEFLKSNLLGIVLVILGYLLYLNLTLLQGDALVLIILRYVMLFCCILFFIMSLMIFQVYVSYKMPFLQYLKSALLIGLTYPHLLLLMVVGIILLQYLLMFIPGIIPFFSISLLAYMMTCVTDFIFIKVESKDQSMESNNEVVPT